MKIFAMITALIAGGFYWAQRYSGDLAGAAPLLHIGIPYGFTLEDMSKVDINGKTFLVTGANTGLGYSTTKILAKHGGRVILGCRNAQKCKNAMAKIVKEADISPDLLLAPTTIDLSSLKSVRKFASMVLGDEEVNSGKLQSLILNAGFIATSHELTPDGIESGFMGNHLGHFELFKLLKDALLKGPKDKRPTVVPVSSSAHLYHRTDLKAGVPLTLDEVNEKRDFDSFLWYGSYKLCNILFTKELDRLYYSDGIIATAVHPGAVLTEFVSRIMDDGGEIAGFMNVPFKVMNEIGHLFAWASDEAALTIVASAVQPIGHGLYTIPIHRPLAPSLLAQDSQTAKQLWELSEKLIADIE